MLYTLIAIDVVSITLAVLRWAGPELVPSGKELITCLVDQRTIQRKFLLLSFNNN